MFKRKNTIKVGMVAAIVALSVGLGACSSSDDDDGGDDTAIDGTDGDGTDGDGTDGDGTDGDGTDGDGTDGDGTCLLYTSPSPRDLSTSRMPSSA